MLNNEKKFIIAILLDDCFFASIINKLDEKKKK